MKYIKTDAHREKKKWGGEQKNTEMCKTVMAHGESADICRVIVGPCEEDTKRRQELYSKKQKP